MVPYNPVKRCMIWGCRTNSTKQSDPDPDILFFRLTPSRHRNWMIALGRNPDEVVSDSNRLCSRHFSEKNFLVIGPDKKELKNGAIPDIVPNFGHQTCIEPHRSSSLGTSQHKAKRFPAFKLKRRFPNMETRPPLRNQCPQCPYEYEWQFQIDHHLKRTHFRTDTFADEKRFHCVIEPEQLSCIHCSFMSYNKLDLYEHRKQKHDSRIVDTIEQGSPYKEFDNCCHVCCSYKSNSSLCYMKHVDTCETLTNPRVDIPSTGITTVADAIIDRLKCTKCSYRTKRRRDLKRHNLVHSSSEETWLCTVCSYKAKEESSLKRHMLTKHGSDEEIHLQCNQCCYKTKLEENLKNHVLTHVPSEINMLTHAEPKELLTWYGCTECSFKSKRENDLKSHKLQHATIEEVAPFACNECPFRTGDKEIFQAHTARHAANEIKVFQCVKCPYKTGNEANLKKHMSQHAAKSEKVVVWLTCTKCTTYKTKRKPDLRRHMLTHASGEEAVWFTCALCPFKSKYKKSLDLHVHIVPK